MKLNKSIILKITVIILIIFSCLVVYGYFSVWIPHKKITDESWLKSTSPVERIRLAHTILKQPIGNHHDALIIVLRGGKKDSIPYLLNYLKRQEDINSGGFIICTRSHCIDALKKITGKDLGWNYNDWKVIEKDFH
jgi:hypothetical protein